jgi:hypothetical protein
LESLGVRHIGFLRGKKLLSTVGAEICTGRIIKIAFETFHGFMGSDFENLFHRINF